MMDMIIDYTLIGLLIGFFTFCIYCWNKQARDKDQ